MRQRKYRNQPTDGYDSKREARFAATLQALRNAKDPAERVIEVREQVEYELIPPQYDGTGRLVERKCAYLADFVVEYADGKVVVYDCKGVRTKDYIIKRKLLLLVHGIRVREV